jgi:integrase
MRKKRTYGTGSCREIEPGKWELRYRPHDADRLSKSVEVTSRKHAEDALSDWRKELDKQKNPGVKVPCSALFELQLADMRRRQRDGKNILDQRKKIEKHLVPFFGKRDALSITLRDIHKYIDQRLDEGAQPATINRELSNLRRSFNCGVQEHVLVHPLPRYEKLPEDNVREGFLEPDVYRKVLHLLPAQLCMLWCFAYYFGIRKGELLKFRWDWLLPYLRQAEPIIKIPGKYTKNKRPHTIPLYHPEMRAMVTLALTQRNPDCPFLFQHRGKQLKDVRSGFEQAREDAGVPELIFHDTRRTAVRNMVLAGISEKRAMQISGHRTRSVFDRYDIATERDAVETGKQMRKHWEERASEEAAEPKLGDLLGDSHIGMNSPRVI